MFRNSFSFPCSFMCLCIILYFFAYSCHHLLGSGLHYTMWKELKCAACLGQIQQLLLYTSLSMQPYCRTNQLVGLTIHLRCEQMQFLLQAAMVCAALFISWSCSELSLSAWSLLTRPNKLNTSFMIIYTA